MNWAYKNWQSYTAAVLVCGILILVALMNDCHDHYSRRSEKHPFTPSKKSYSLPKITKNPVVSYPEKVVRDDTQGNGELSNSEIIDVLKGSEISRMINFKQTDSDGHVKFDFEITAPTTVELSKLRKIAYAAKGTLLDSGIPLDEYSRGDQLLSDYLIQQFYLRQGYGNARVSLDFSERNPGTVLCNTRAKLLGTRTTESNGDRFVLGKGWRFDKVIEVDYGSDISTSK